MSDLISVIVPIYKVEEYLARCVESLINQTYKNLEIILVDDGSPDSCPEICDEYANKDNRIKVVHKKNGGLSDARNAGMQMATGEYISFIDSDDYVSLDFIEVLYSTMISQDSDIVECSVVKFYEDGRFDEYSDDLKITNFDTVNGLSALISENPFHQHVWNKLYKSKYVIDVPYAVGKLNEDEFWTYQIFGQAKKVTKINKTMYYYFQRQNSIMGNQFNLKRLDAVEGIANRQKYIDEKFPELSKQSKINLFGSCMFACQSSMKFLSHKDKKIAMKILKDYAKSYKLTKDELNMLSGKIKFWFSFANKCFFLGCKVRSILGVGF